MGISAVIIRVGFKSCKHNAWISGAAWHDRLHLKLKQCVDIQKSCVMNKYPHVYSRM